MSRPRSVHSSLVTHHSSLRNPLAAKELRGRMRGPRTFVAVTLFLLPLGALAVILYAGIAASTSGNLAGGVPVGKLFFAIVSTLELCLICGLAPTLTADLISSERERRTYDLLLVTPLSAGQIVVGKLVPALGSLLLLIVVALPIQAIGILLGGVGPEEVAIGFAILVLTAVAYGSIGLFWSARVRSTRGAVALAFATTALGVAGLPVLAILALLGTQLFEVSTNPLTTMLVGGRGSLDSSVEAQALAIVGQIVAATNPPLTALLSAIVVTQGRPLLFVERLGGQDVAFVAPWLVFILFHIALIGLVVWRTTKALRR